MIELKLIRVELEFRTGTPVVLLRETQGERRVLPIFIGKAEAQAIALANNKVVPPRPLTHDLLVTAIDVLGCELSHVSIVDLRDKTFFAEIYLKRDTGVETLSCRPSDAIALAARTGVLIEAAPKVMDEAGFLVEESDLEDLAADKDEIDDETEFVGTGTDSESMTEEDIGHAMDEFREFIDGLTPEDFEES